MSPPPEVVAYYKNFPRPTPSEYEGYVRHPLDGIAAYAQRVGCSNYEAKVVFERVYPPGADRA